MKHCQNRKGIAPSVPKNTHQKAVAITVNQHIADRCVGYLNLIVMLGLSVTFLLSSVSYARSESTLQSAAQSAPQLAALPITMPAAPLSMAAKCDRGVMVFSVQNKAARWQKKGNVRVVEVESGRVLRERNLVFGERQVASFRMPSPDPRPVRYRVMVHHSDRGMVYVKSFTGYCAEPKVL